MSPDEMATETKPWPHHAEWARMDSIAAAIKARNNLTLAMAHITDATTLKMIFDAINSCRDIEMYLTLARGKESEDVR